MTKRCPTQSNI